MGANNTLRPRAKAALDAAIVYSPRHLHNPSPFSPTPFVTIEVDGQHTLQPRALLSGYIRPLPKRGIGNFWRWFNGFRLERLGKEDGGSENRRRGGSSHDGTAGPWTTDDAGRPGLFFYGTDVEIQTFDLAHPNRKDKVWLVRGGYLTSSIYRRKFPASGRFRYPAYGRAHVVAREPGGSP